MKNYLKIYLITPKIRINWSTPRRLLLTSAINSFRKDYAPIGHFAVEIKCSRPNHFGIGHVLTGMERKNKVESRKIVIKEKLGLGSLNYSFAGALQTFDESHHDIEMAKKENRLRILSVLLSENRSKYLLDFLEKWIHHGSYTVYGGMKDTLHGQGAGCADFAMTFFELATGHHLDDWNVKLKIPKILMGGHHHKVSLLKLLATSSWNTNEDYVDFKTADGNLAADWIDKKNSKLSSPSISSIEYIYSNEIHEDKKFDPLNFKYTYPQECSESSLWESIKFH